MIIIREAETLSNYISKERSQGKVIGFVPTMGALHQGHLALVEQSKNNSHFTVCSIFVNPTQFNNAADYRQYPNVITKDIELLAQSGADILFMPAIEEVYPQGTAHLEHYDLGYLETVLEGKYRPGHFQGVCQVMSRLLKMVKPDKLFMGLKDYQQCMVVKRLIAIMKADIEFVACPTLREPDGLAMSSRNLRLSPDARGKAPAIYRVLEQIKNELRTGDLTVLKENARQQLVAAGFAVDYAEIADAITLRLVNDWDGRTPLVALIAASLGEVRLIDNMAVS